MNKTVGKFQRNNLHHGRESVRKILSAAALLQASMLLAAGETVRPATPAHANQPLRYVLTHVLHRVGYVNAMASTPDGSLLAVAGDDGRVALWNTASGSTVRVLPGHGSAVYTVAISPDGATLATAGLDETIHIWDLSSARERRTLTGHHGWINAVAFTVDGRTLVSAGRDRTVRAWDVENGKMLRVTDFPSEVFTVATDARGELFASDKGNSFSIREMATGSETSGGALGQWGINAIAFSPASAELMTGGYDGFLWVWSIREAHVSQHIQVEGSPIISLALTGNGSLLAALCTGNGTVVLFDTATWKELERLEGVNYPVGSVVFSADGQMLAAGGGDSPIRIWHRSDPE